MTTVIIDDNNPQARQFLKYTRTLPFARVERRRRQPKSTWQQAIDEGAVPLESFIDELRRQVNEHYDKLENDA